MSKIDWKDLLGWSEVEVSSLRFVAYSYIRQGHYETATTILESLLVISPKNVYDLQTLGAIYLQEGNALKALNFFDQSLELEPENTSTLLNRAKALFILGYKIQGTKEATKLKTAEDKVIAKEAEALLLSFA
jgi:tetratricopeptide (TPR) repeat protein